MLSSVAELGRMENGKRLLDKGDLTTRPAPSVSQIIGGTRCPRGFEAVHKGPHLNPEMERETRFELATLSLATRCSTTELLPRLRTWFYTRFWPYRRHHF